MTIQVTPDFQSGEVHAFVDIKSVDPTHTYVLKTRTGVEKILNPDADGMCNPVKIMNLDEYLSYVDINLKVQNTTTGLEVESNRHIPLPITIGLAVALVERDGTFLRLPGMGAFASNLAIAKLAYRTSGNAIFPYIPAGFQTENIRVASTPRFNTGGRGSISTPRYQKNPNYVGNPLTKAEMKELDAIRSTQIPSVQARDGRKEGQDDTSRIGNQFNFFSLVRNGNAAPKINSPTIVGIGSARVNTSIDPVKPAPVPVVDEGADDLEGYNVPKKKV